MKTLNGIYKAVCLEIVPPRVIRCKVPQIFADETVTCGASAGVVPTAGQEGWVGFESGFPDRPVWVGTNLAKPDEPPDLSPYLLAAGDTMDGQLRLTAGQGVKGPDGGPLDIYPGTGGWMDVHGLQIGNTGTPTSDDHAANKGYVDDGVEGHNHDGEYSPPGHVHYFPLDTINDVEITSPFNNDVLAYRNADGMWVNRTLSIPTYADYTKATGITSWGTGIDAALSTFAAAVINGRWVQATIQIIATGAFTTGAYNVVLATMTAPLRPAAVVQAFGLIYNGYTMCRVSIQTNGNVQILSNSMPAGQTQIWVNLGWPLY